MTARYLSAAWRVGGPVESLLKATGGLTLTRTFLCILVASHTPDEYPARARDGVTVFRSILVIETKVHA
jgi:hypothetical protein